MARELPNATTVEITCRPDDDGPELFVDNRTLKNIDDEDTIFVEHDWEEGQPEPQVLVVVRSQAGNGHTAYAWQQTSGSTYDAWSAHEGGGRSKVYRHDPQELEIRIALAPTGAPPPEAPPAPGSGSTVLKVNVRKKGAMPLTLGDA